MKTIASLVSTLTALTLAALPGQAQSYNVSYTAGGSWSTVYAQGFSTSLGATPAPGISLGDTVDLTQFQFFKSGTSDTAANIQLAIFNTLFPNTVGLTTSSSSLVGLSANTISSTSPLATGDAVTFTFNNLPLTYGNDYAAYFVNIDGSGNITPVLVSALTANYVDDGTGTFHPTPNYGTETQFQYATGNFISGGFLSDFNFAGDANFNATLMTVPEPTTCALMGLGILAMVRRAVRRNAK